MKVLQTKKSSYLSVKYFCMDLLKSPQMKVRLLPQCFELEKIGIQALSIKLERMLMANGFDIISIPSGVYHQPEFPKIILLLHHMKIQVELKVQPTKEQAKLLPISLLNECTRKQTNNSNPHKPKASY